MLMFQVVSLLPVARKRPLRNNWRLYTTRPRKDKLHLVLIKTLVCQSLAASTPAEALAFLAEALTLGQPEGFIRTFVDEGRLLAPLLRKALSQGITPEYTGKLLNIIEAEESAGATPEVVETAPPSHLPDP